MVVEVADAAFAGREVFIVQGHIETPKSQLRNLLSSLGLQPIKEVAAEISLQLRDVGLP
jgi:hypothetical protein